MAAVVECQLCPKYCRIPPDGTGDCRVRMNDGGKLIATTYGRPCAVHVDPIEKKPLFHFLPGTTIFSIATAGCNLHCRNCQNHSISQANPEDVEAYHLSPGELLAVARKQEAISIAYTYTEPLTWFEYTYDSCVLASEAGINNVLVTAGYVNRKPLKHLLRFVDAANVDLKAFDETFYKENCAGSLRPVLATLETMVEQGVWLEITNLLIPTLNDDMKMVGKMCRWIVDKLGPEVPLHFSRFHPQHQLRNLPPTPGETLENARQEALDAGLKYVYVGNLRSRQGENTWCPNSQCPEKGRPLVARAGYRILDNRMVNGRCPACGTAVAGRWEDR